MEWTLERENSDLGALGRLMISGRITLDGKRKIAIWNILDWRNPDLVMEKSLALLSSGWDQVWVFAPGICKELELKKHDVRVAAFERNVTHENAEGTIAELLRARLFSPQITSPPQKVTGVEEFAHPEAQLAAGVGENPERTRLRHSLLEHYAIKPLDPDVDSGWGQSIKEFLTSLAVTFDSQRRFPLSMGRAHYYTADFFVGSCEVVIEPHRDDRIDDEFMSKLRIFRREYPKVTVVLVTKQLHDRLIGDVCDHCVLYDPPEFKELGSILRQKHCFHSTTERKRTTGSDSAKALGSSRGESEP